MIALLLGLVGALALWVALAGRVLVSSGQRGEADAVMVLAGSPHGWRLAAGVDAFRVSVARRLIVSIGSIGPIYDARPDMLRYLEERGVPSEVVRFVTGARSTADEAGFAAALVQQCGWRSLIVVTSPSHTRRAGWIFRRGIRGAAAVTTVASDEPFRSGMWWSNERDAEAVLLEWVKGLVSIRYVFRRPTAGDPGVPC